MKKSKYSNSSVYRKQRERKKKKLKQQLIHLTFLVIFIIAATVAELHSHIISDLVEETLRSRRQGSFSVLRPDSGQLHIHYIDVGQGDSTVIMFPDGKNMIIDAGLPSAKQTVLDFIRAADIMVFDYMLLTHPDDDHVGGLSAVIEATEVKNIYLPDVEVALHNTASYRNFLSAVQDEQAGGAQVIVSRAGLVIEGEDYRIIFFTPTLDMYNGLTSSSNLNDISPIIYLEFGNKKAVFTGDATKKTENVFISVINGDRQGEGINSLSGYNPQADLYKAGHHGSETSSSENFIKLLNPPISVISVGTRYNNMPHPEVLSRLSAYGTVYSTLLSGNITAVLSAEDGEVSIAMHTQNNPPQNGDNAQTKALPKRGFVAAAYIFWGKSTDFLYA